MRLDLTYENWLKLVPTADQKKLNDERRKEKNGRYEHGEVRDYFVSITWKEPAEAGDWTTEKDEETGKDIRVRATEPVMYGARFPKGADGFACRAEAFYFQDELWTAEMARADKDIEYRDLVTTILKRKRWITYEPPKTTKSKTRKRDKEIDEEFDKPTLRSGTYEVVPNVGENKVPDEKRAALFASLRQTIRNATAIR